MIHDRIPPRDGERIDPDTCPDCFHLFEECACESAHTEPNTQQGQTTLLRKEGDATCSTPTKAGLTETATSGRTSNAAQQVQSPSAADDELCEWFDSLPKPPEPLPWLPQEKTTDRHPFQ